MRSIGKITLYVLIGACAIPGAIFYILLVFAAFKPDSASPSATTETKQLPVQNEQVAPEIITLNVCETDKENKDFWQRTNINLFEFPNLKGRSFQIPSCASIPLEVIDKKTENGIEIYLVRYQDGQGWQTKRLLTGQE